MQNFQNLGTKSKIAIASVAVAGVIGGVSLIAPSFTESTQPSIVTPITQETPIDPSATPTFDFIHCIKHHGRDGNGGGAVQVVCLTPTVP